MLLLFTSQILQLKTNCEGKNLQSRLINLNQIEPAPEISKHFNHHLLQFITLSMHHNYKLFAAKGKDIAP